MDSSKAKTRRPAGALGQVLEQVKNAGFSREKSSQVSQRPTAAPPAPVDRFYPTKGFTRVPASVCRPWALADRPDVEFGHQDEVGRSLQSDGQIQPVVVRVLNDPAHPELKYEVIAGQVRWRAAVKAGLELDVVIRELSDEAAFRAMVAENEFRKGLSDYARGTRLKKALEAGLYKDKSSLAAACGLSNSQLSYLLGFAELDPTIVARFSDVTAISARLGYELHAAVNGGFRSQVLRDLPAIESGQISRHQIPDIWRDGTESTPETLVSEQGRRGRVASVPYRAADGRVLFLVKPSSSGGPTLRFAKPLATKLDESFMDDLREWVDRRISQSMPREGSSE